RDVEIAVLAAIPAAVALARYADARAVGEAGRYVDHDRLGAHLDLLAVAGRTPRRPPLTGAAAVRARTRKHHVAARRFDRPFAAAERARPFDFDKPVALAAAAVLLPRDGDGPLPAVRR